MLFDFGGVFTPSPFAVVREHGTVAGNDPETILRIVFGEYDQDTDHPWHRLERGEISLQDCRDQIMAIAAGMGRELDPFDALRGMAGGHQTEEPFVARGIALRAAGYRTGLITNNIKEFADGWRSLIPVDELFEIVIDSCVVGMRKPNPKIFEMALAELGANAHETVFIDDFPGNIVAAEALGMHGVLVGADRAAAVASLDELLAQHPRA